MLQHQSEKVETGIVFDERCPQNPGSSLAKNAPEVKAYN